MIPTNKLVIVCENKERVSFGDISSSSVVDWRDKYSVLLVILDKMAQQNKKKPALIGLSAGFGVGS